MTSFPVQFSVLSSSSGGNSSALLVGEGAQRQIVLIDAGLSPRQTRLMLGQIGASEREVSAVVLTHLDSDHFHAGWLRFLRRGIPIWLHRSHAGRAERAGILYRKTELFGEEFEPHPGLRFRVAMLAHDDLGVAIFRVELGGSGRSLGYATDLGHPTGALFRHLAGVHVLAIESNYCPRLQIASGRPRQLQERIMGGSGHLSNLQSAETVAQIGVHERVVLLHLSRQCNAPEIAVHAHRDHGVPVTVSRHDAPMPWMDLLAPAPVPPRPARVAASLFEMLPVGPGAAPTLGHDLPVDVSGNPV